MQEERKECMKEGMHVGGKKRVHACQLGRGAGSTYQPADVTLAFALDAVHLVLVCLVGSAQVRRLGLVGLHAVAERLLGLLACSLELQDFLLQPQALAIKGPARLLSRLGQQRRLDLVGRAVAQHIQRGLQPLQLALLDLGRARRLLLVLPDEQLAQRLQLLGLVLVQLGPELRDVGRVPPLLLLPFQLGLLQPLAQFAHLRPEPRDRGSGSELRGASQSQPPPPRAAVCTRAPGTLPKSLHPNSPSCHPHGPDPQQPHLFSFLLYISYYFLENLSRGEKTSEDAGEDSQAFDISSNLEIHRRAQFIRHKTQDTQAEIISHQRGTYFTPEIPFQGLCTGLGT